MQVPADRKGFAVKFTTDPDEIRAAQRLRFEVFNLELHRGLKSAYAEQLDVDPYDSVCQHLIVIDRARDRVVGTYRLLLGAQARRHFGFYAEREFDLANLKRLSGELLELGRTCIHRDYRDQALIDLMWRGIATLVRRARVRYLFGCASVYSTDADEVSSFYALLKSRYYAAPRFRVQPLPQCRFPRLREGVAAENPAALFMRLPSLIKAYLRVGARLCGPPALDREFGSADFFLLLDVEELGPEIRERFGLAKKGHHAMA
jgi:putative hemolysin